MPTPRMANLTVLLHMQYDSAQPIMFDQTWQQDALVSSVMSVLPPSDDAADVLFINATGSTRADSGTISVASIGGRRLLVTASAGSAAVSILDVPQPDVPDTVFALKVAVQDDSLAKTMQTNGRTLSDCDYLQQYVLSLLSSTQR